MRTSVFSYQSMKSDSEKLVAALHMIKATSILQVIPLATNSLTQKQPFASLSNRPRKEKALSLSEMAFGKVSVVGLTHV